MYLQLHDDWTTDNFPGFTTDKFAMVGKKPMPLKKVYALSGTCAVNLPSDLLKTTGQGWVDAIKNVQNQYKAIAEGKKTLLKNRLLNQSLINHHLNQWLTQVVLLPLLPNGLRLELRYMRP
jgi:hypothetical protein